MKRPKAERCPCCDVRTVTAAEGFETVRPQCRDQLEDTSGRPTGGLLVWVCQVCGCEWCDESQAEIGC